nr:zinc-binding dehydrogenase [Arthrobacter alpinus]
MIATASAKNHAWLRELGTEPVEYGDGLVGCVHALAPDGVDAVADWTVLDHGGQYIWVRPDARELERLSALVDAGKLLVDVDASYPMQELATAFAAGMSGHGSGKNVLTPFTD